MPDEARAQRAPASFDPSAVGRADPLFGLVWWLAGGQAKRVDGVLELALPDRPPKTGAVRWQLPCAAITLGHVVLAVNAHEMHRWRAHERVHVGAVRTLGPAVSASVSRVKSLAMGAGPATLLGQPLQG